MNDGYFLLYLKEERNYRLNKFLDYKEFILFG